MRHLEGAVFLQLNQDALADAGQFLHIADKFKAIVCLQHFNWRIVRRIGARDGLGGVPEPMTAVQRKAGADPGHRNIRKHFEDIRPVIDKAADDPRAEIRRDRQAEAAVGDFQAIPIDADITGFHPFLR